jgi:Protein of unknown function (DUF2630)
MDDQDVIDQINQLAHEEHSLFQKASTDEGLSSREHDRLKFLEVQLDQCWDLMRQRRARRSAGLDPEGAHARDSTVVERYEQ